MGRWFQQSNGESETRIQHSIKDILFNLVYIHRTYSLTYTSQQEIFVPIVGPKFVFEDGTNNVFFSARLSSHNPPSKVAKRLPPSVKLDPSASDGTLLSTTSVAVLSVRKPTSTDLTAIAGMAKSLREDLYYINGAQTLWYVKTVPKGTTRIQRQSTTLTLAAMHRLSELCRYTPMHMARYLEGQKKWLLSEFIRISGSQFLDEIASEITGKNFMIPNVRPAS